MKILGMPDIGPDHQIEWDAARERADDAQVQAAGRCAEGRGAAAVGDVHLPARHAGDHHRRAGHVDLLYVHTVLGKEPFFLRDPERAHPRADIRVGDDDFGRGEYRPWSDDDAKQKNCYEGILLHHQ